MLRIQGRTRAACDGISRRTLLEAAGAGLFGLSLPALLRVAWDHKHSVTQRAVDLVSSLPASQLDDEPRDLHGVSAAPMELRIHVWHNADPPRR